MQHTDFSNEQDFYVSCKKDGKRDYIPASEPIIAVSRSHIDDIKELGDHAPIEYWVYLNDELVARFVIEYSLNGSWKPREVRK